MVEARHITMDFRIDQNRTTNLKEFVVDTLRRQTHTTTFRALDDVSFTAEKGSVTGLIGHNGAGKSTLLKIISGIYPPTSGSVALQGTLVPMLELGSGFDAELTGRENIFLNGAILGYPKDFLHDKAPEIIAYSELDCFIDRPLKTYSSGMLARLAFSIATVVQPDILIVDEILAVGDFHFQEKCEQRINSMINDDTTVIIVSHSIEQIERLCKHCVWLEKGKIRMIGDAKEVCDAYKNS